jgi:hypothetical protein
VNAPHHPRLFKPSAETAPTPGTADLLEISPAAEAAVRAAESGAIRSDLVARIRTEIAAGSYETPDKLDAALERLLDEIG